MYINKFSEHNLKNVQKIYSFITMQLNKHSDWINAQPHPLMLDEQPHERKAATKVDV